MSRYIDAEWLMNFFTDIPNNFTLTIGNLRATVDDAPSIDIVHCRECKYWMDDRKDEDDMGTCGLTHYFANTDDFCSYGEREGE